MLKDFQSHIKQLDQPIFVQEIFMHPGHGEYKSKTIRPFPFERLKAHLSDLVTLTETIHNQTQKEKNTITRLLVNEFGFYTQKTPIDYLEFIQLIEHIHTITASISGDIHFLLASFGIKWSNDSIQNGLLYVQGGLNTESKKPSIRFFAKENDALDDLGYTKDSSDRNYPFFPDSKDRLKDQHQIERVFESLYQRKILSKDNQFYSAFQISTTHGAKAYVTVDVCIDHHCKTGYKNLEDLIRQEQALTNQVLPIYVNHLITSSAVKDDPNKSQGSIIHISTIKSVEKVGHLSPTPFNADLRNQIKQVFSKNQTFCPIQFSRSKKTLKFLNPKFGDHLSFKMYPPKHVALLNHKLLSKVFRHSKKLFPKIQATHHRVNFPHTLDQTQLHLELKKSSANLERISSLITHQADFFATDSTGKTPLDYLALKNIGFINKTLRHLGKKIPIFTLKVDNHYFFEWLLITLCLDKFKKTQHYRKLKEGKSPLVKERLLRISLKHQQIEKFIFILKDFSDFDHIFLSKILKDTFHKEQYAYSNAILNAYPDLLKIPSIIKAYRQILQSTSPPKWMEKIYTQYSTLYAILISSCLYLTEDRLENTDSVYRLSLEIAQLKIRSKKKLCLDPLALESIALCIDHFDKNYNFSMLLKIVFTQFDNISLKQILNHKALNKFSTHTLETYILEAIDKNKFEKFRLILSFYLTEHLKEPASSYSHTSTTLSFWINEIIHLGRWSFLVIIPLKYQTATPQLSTYLARGFNQLPTEKKPLPYWINQYPQKAKAAHLLEKECSKKYFCQKTILTLIKYDSLFTSPSTGSLFHTFLMNCLDTQSNLDFLHEIDNCLGKNNQPPLLYQILTHGYVNAYEIVLKHAKPLSIDSIGLKQNIMIQYILNPSLCPKLGKYLKLNRHTHQDMTCEFKAQFSSWPNFCLKMRRLDPLIEFIRIDPSLLTQQVKGTTFIKRIENNMGKRVAKKLKDAYSPCTLDDPTHHKTNLKRMT